MNGYERTRAWFNFCFEHPDRIKPIHHAVYLYAVELCNRLGWKKKFGLPTDSTMEVLGVKNHRTYKNAFNDLIEWGFITMIQKSKNQYTANVIALVKSTETTTKALDKAIQLQGQGNATIDKQINEETINKKILLKVDISNVPEHQKKYFELAQKLQKVICKNLQEKGVPYGEQENISFIDGVNPIQMMIEQDHITISQIEKAIYLLNSQEGIFWKGIILTPKNFRRNITRILATAPGKLKGDDSLAKMNDSVQQKLKRYE